MQETEELLKPETGPPKPEIRGPGVRDVDRITKATELKSLQGREDFKNLLAGLEATVKADALVKDTKAAPEEKLKANQAKAELGEKLAAADPDRFEKLSRGQRALSPGNGVQGQGLDRHRLPRQSAPC